MFAWALASNKQGKRKPLQIKTAAYSPIQSPTESLSTLLPSEQGSSVAGLNLMTYAPAIQKLADLLKAENITPEQREIIASAVDWAEYLRADLANSQWGEGTWRIKYNLLKGELSGKPCLKP